MVSDLLAILDAILWRVGAAYCEMWNGHHHGYVCMASKLPRVVPIRVRLGLVYDLGTQMSTTTLPTTTAECVKCALRAEYHLNKKKESQLHQSEVPKNNNNNQNCGNFRKQGRSQGGQWNNNKRKRNHNNCQGGGHLAS
ncbi:hypothetical protein TIFTF001_030770 [Ficus carica]|uniref:Uncharacterized protein n=1 Tax=Ficus carica TaxID=3494 RepID=A0AA88J486_FICCA|nr:hypothetical protein TIFTF001_030770 [Ficus carica]